MDVLEQITDVIDRGLTLEENFNPPLKYKNNGGGDLFAYPPDQIPKAMLFYLSHMKNKEYGKARDILNHLTYSMSIESLSLMLEETLCKHIHEVPFLNRKMDLKEIMTTLFAEFINRSLEETRNLVEKSDEIYKKKWEETVHDEDNVTGAQLGKFYNSLPFAVGCSSITCYRSHLSMAYRFIPCYIAQKIPGIKNVFDFGGNIGSALLLIANLCDIDKAVLIEENEDLLKFAQWRDKTLKLKPMIYKKESEILNSITDHEGQYDFGISIEVLEHLIDVESALNTMNRLLRTGGYFFLTSSFQLYPHPSHLKKNLKYAGKEKELMREFGFQPVSFQTPIPLLAKSQLYRKIT